MADINKSIEFNESQANFIKNKLEDLKFSYKNWGDDDLSDLRKEIRNFYRVAQKGKCSYCKKDVSLVSANNCHIEHIAPKSGYPSFIFEPKNLCVICADCNEIKRHQETTEKLIDTVEKGDKRKIYPRSSNAFKIVHPHFDNYEEHILIITTGYYLDKSKKGHFTIGACKLNRKLYNFGWEKEVIDDDKVTVVMQAYLKEKNTAKRRMLLKKLQLLLLEV